MVGGFSCASSLVFALLPFYVSHQNSQVINRSYFGFLSAGFSPFALVSSFFLLALFLWGVLKIVFAYVYADEKAEKASFALYLVWPALYLVFAVAAYLFESNVLFFIILPFALIALAVFYWDYHLFGQN